jgi:hypothetical protein
VYRRTTAPAEMEGRWRRRIQKDDVENGMDVVCISNRRIHVLDSLA